MCIYRVTNWSENFENNRTRKMKQMMWVPVPNKHDGDGYTELVDRDNGAEMLGAWLAILQVASKCAERGTLVRDNGTPHTPRTISRLTRLSEPVIKEAITLLCSKDVGWLQVVDNSEVAPSCHEGARSAHPTDEEGNRMEWNGIEGTEGEGSESAAPEIIKMAMEAKDCRQEFKNLNLFSFIQAIHGAGENPRLTQNHQEFIADMANSLEAPKIPAKLYARYLQSDGKPKQQKKGKVELSEL